MSNEIKSTTITIRVPEAVREQLEKMAKQSNTTISRYMLGVIYEHFGNLQTNAWLLKIFFDNSKEEKIRVLESEKASDPALRRFTKLLTSNQFFINKLEDEGIDLDLLKGEDKTE